MVNKSPADLFSLIKSLAGVNDFTSEEETNLQSLANRRLRMAYNTTPMWERYVVTSEERKVCNFTVDGITDTNSFYKWSGGYYKLGEDSVGRPYYVQAYHDYGNQPIVAYKLTTTTNQWVFVKAVSISINTDGVVSLTSGFPLVSQVANDDGTYTNHENPADVEQWSITGSGLSGFPVIEKTNLVQYEETYFLSDLTISGKTAKDDIQDFIRIHRNKSFLNQSSTEYDFYVNNRGANLLNIGDINSVFVTYKKPLLLPVPTGTESDSILEFASEYDQIPLEFFNYMAHGTYADFLRMDGQHDKAAFEEQKADMFLATELERIDIINNNNSLNHKFTTYVNTSSR